MCQNRQHMSANNYQQVGMGGCEKVQAAMGNICLPAIISKKWVWGGRSEKVQAEMGNIHLPTVISNYQQYQHLVIIIYMLSMARTMQNVGKTTLGSTRQSYFQQSSQRQIHQKDQQEHVYLINFIAQLPDNTPILSSPTCYIIGFLLGDASMGNQQTSIVTSAMMAASACSVVIFVHGWCANAAWVWKTSSLNSTLLTSNSNVPAAMNLSNILTRLLCKMCLQKGFEGTKRKLHHWMKKVGLLCARLKGWNFGCKIIFIMVHSIVTHGDLFAGKDKDGDVAMMVEDFMDYVFTPPLNEVVYRSTLFMLTCGHVVSLWPEYIILFTTPEFILTATKLFAMAYSIQVLIHGHSFLDIFHDLLNVSLDLRMHTDVLVFYISSLLALKAPFSLRIPTLDVAQPPSILGYQYSWYHSHWHPWGKALPMGCSRCSVVHPWSQSKCHLNGNDLFGMQLGGVFRAFAHGI
ncbi:hypothetical protein F5141DRAFT_1062080 [Pisolithus sp. B1]|nr:hypothetical protein F5141DRAFT_1062080 [Pisolithus sp. B1]